MSEGKPRFYTEGHELFCDWRGGSYRVVEVSGERFLVPKTVWDLEHFRLGIERALEEIVQVFREALARGVPYEDARYLLPEGSISRLEFEGTIDV